MKLVKKISTLQRHSAPQITFSKNGCIFLSLAFKDAVKPDVAKSKIGIYQDEESPRDWYVRIEEDGLNMRLEKGNGKIITQSSSISRDFLKCFGFDQRASCRIGASPIEGGYYAIITKSIQGK